VVAQHGGSIRVEDNAGGGALFRVSLRVAPTRADRPAMDEAKAVVHVVEDDDSVRTAVVRLLRTAGFQAQPYASAAEFLLVAGENAGGCMVLDVGLPA
jgi:hypothetical protein